MADKKKKQQKEKEKEEEAVNDNAPNPLDLIIEQAKSNSTSIQVVQDILSETILQKAAEHLYNKYLTPKIMPYTALQTMELAATQVRVSRRYSQANS